VQTKRREADVCDAEAEACESVTWSGNAGHVTSPYTIYHHNITPLSFLQKQTYLEVMEPICTDSEAVHVQWYVYPTRHDVPANFVQVQVAELKWTHWQ
jgi:hypothetical protein